MAHTASAVGSRLAPARASVLLVGGVALALAVAVAGGSSWNARTPLIALELAAIPVALLSASRLAHNGAWRAAWPCLGLAAVAVAIPLLQSFPLPPAVWVRLPAEQPRFTAAVLSGLDLSAEPISLDPRATLAAGFALLPAIALMLSTLCLGAAERRVLATVWILAALAGLLLGLAQLAEPQGGWAYLYSRTNEGYLVGWFANRNHEAALLLALTPLAAALAGRPGFARWVAWPFLLVVLVALAANRSRAGILLAAPICLLSLLVLARSGGARKRLEVAVFGATALASLAAAGIFAFSPIARRFVGGAPEVRFEAWPVVWREAVAHLPWGAGVGAFDRVFRAAEPVALVAPTFFNHAHNDYLEALLETGVAGVAILLVFVAWLAPAVWRAWSREGSSMARAASVSVLAFLAMSGVDYPLRTPALMSLFAVCCALLVPPPEEGRA